jgi:hypothetical protein
MTTLILSICKFLSSYDGICEYMRVQNILTKCANDRRGARGRAHCTSTGELSHRCMFLNRASVQRHIAASKPCRDANMGIREILLEARAGDVMSGGGGAAGPTPDVRHQPAGDVQADIQNNIVIPCKT